MENYYPKIRLGGMGVNISDWLLAKTLSLLNQIGTLSGTALERVVARILQNGDPGGHVRRALSHFPFPEHAEKVLKAYFVKGGIKKDSNFKAVPFFSINPTPLLISLTVCANYAFVWLAKEGHENPISINYLDKISFPHIYAITGAMLAGVDEISMGAGIPLQIPKVIADIYSNNTVSYTIPVVGKNITTYEMKFNPKSFFGQNLEIKRKPKFLPIISSNLLAQIYINKLPPGSIYGFVIEEPTAGGHNAPPRNKVEYGAKDIVNYSEIEKLGLPFWIGGSFASPEKLKWALSVGAKGIQAGSIFALCKESGMWPVYRKEICKLGFNDELKVRTDMRVSPTNYPFKVAIVSGTLSEDYIYENRNRVCSQGCLRSIYEKPDGKIGYRCSAESEFIYEQKGGKKEDTVGRACLCNGLLSACGVGDSFEFPIITLGDDFSFLKKLMKNESDSYSAKDAVNYLIS
ncbi:MAG TPA: nitronate monooxygenase [Candidatus Paceibacterota bacterium]